MCPTNGDQTWKGKCCEKKPIYVRLKKREEKQIQRVTWFNNMPTSTGDDKGSSIIKQADYNSSTQTLSQVPSSKHTLDFLTQKVDHPIAFALVFQYHSFLLLIPYFVRPQFACWTSINPKISFSFHGSMRTSRTTWRNPFPRRST